MKEERSIIVIGAGIAGLAAGCYARMNGFKTQIFEQHNLPGGLCASWRRQGYTFDGCIHWLVGSSPANSLYEIWTELGALKGKKIINHEEFMRYEGRGGKTFILYTDALRLKEHLLQIAPEDEKLIEKMVSAIQKLADFTPPVSEKLTDKLSSLAGLLRALPYFIKYKKTSLAEFAQGFSNLFLREAIYAIFNLPDFPALGFFMTMGWMSKKTAGYPIGGSLKFAQAIEERYRKLSGEIHYQARVEKVLVVNDRAVGVRLTDGKEYRADYIISAADGYSTIFKLLGGKYVNDKIRGYYEKMPIFESLIQVSLGVKMDFSTAPHSFSFPLDKPITIGGRDWNRMALKHYCYDPSLAPAGSTVLIALFSADYGYWEKFLRDPSGYKEEKEKITETVLGELEKRYPGLREKVEVVDLATPLTFERYTGNWRGSMEGWLLTTKNMTISMEKTLPGLENFYMAGQWVQPGGGIPPAALSGREAIKTICRAEQRKFHVIK